MAERVFICEMSPRDGMQALNRSGRIPFEMRLELIRSLRRARLPYIEVGSFVSPRVLPHMEDTPRLFEHLSGDGYAGQLAALVPNVRQYERFKETPNLTTVALFVSASEAYSQKNKRVGIAEDLEDAGRIAGLARDAGHRLRAHVSAAFRDPLGHRGETDPALVTRVCRELAAIGCQTIALADTDGRATPRDVQRTIAAVLDAGIEPDRLGVHLHDRFGHAIANAWEAYRLGIRSFDSAIGGIGGNRALEDAVGNIATESLASFFEQVGVETGLDAVAIREALGLVYQMTLLTGEPRPSTRLMDEILATGPVADGPPPG
jgi:hydroxymethylglutaryl-CoA lyase